MKRKILLIDDDINSLEYLIEYLSKEFDISVCTNKKDFFYLIEKKTFDLFLLDINLEEITGLELCKKLKETKKHKYKPVIFITGYNDIDMIEEGFSLGAADYMVKPFRTEELEIRIKTHIKNSLIQEKLRLKHLELTSEIEQLTLELNEQMFQGREYLFKTTNKKVEMQKNASNDLNQKFEQIQMKLEKQKEMLENTKLLLQTEY